jgi:beta-glucanase (GH16 family)
MKNPSLFFILFLIPILFNSCKTNPDPNMKEPNKWEMVWSDEFSKDGIPDTSMWAYDTGGHGWGNKERQYYTKLRPENARVENGNLIIEARKEPMDTNKYTSVRLVTKGKEEFTYGRFEIRAKLPRGRGSWPAIWMLAAEQSYGDSYWPDNGEIDIMEHVGFHQGFIHASTHSKKYFWQIGTQQTDTIYSADVSDTFHTYSME